jgi:hypothetical protein
MVEFGEIKNLLGLRTQGANYCDDGFIATIQPKCGFVPLYEI